VKPLKVAILIKPGCPPPGEGRNMGYFSYDVPEFTYQYFSPGGGNIDLRLYNNFDVIYHEDAGNWGDYIRDKNTPPVVYMSIDSTLSDTHYQERLKQGGKSDLILVDHDKIERFKVSGKPVRRLTYCVNDHLFKPLEKTLDVSFHCGSGARKGYPGGKERNELRAQLDGICKELGLSYESGVLGLPQYAAALGRAKVVINLPRTPINRPHRVFDAMAAGACLLTAPIPWIEEDLLGIGFNKTHIVFENINQLPEILELLLKGLNFKGWWYDTMLSGSALVEFNHTWSIRAQQLRQILNEELGL
jgi:hypothetical protein